MKTLNQAKVDARLYKEQRRDVCQLCGAVGQDHRTLRMGCSYQLKEAVPEMLDLSEVEGGGNSTYHLRICKACRGSLLEHLESWRSFRVGLRDKPKDSEGDLLIETMGQTIPVRRYGAVVYMTIKEYREYTSKVRGADMT